MSAFWVSLGVGVLSAMGVGGGTLLMIWLCVFTDTPQKTAQAVNLIYFLPAGAAGLFSHVKNRLVSLRAFARCAPAAVAASVAGSIAATWVDGELLRRLFGAALVFVGLSRLFGKKP